jgi:hypothetical protein
VRKERVCAGIVQQTAYRSSKRRQPCAVDRPARRVGFSLALRFPKPAQMLIGPDVKRVLLVCSRACKDLRLRLIRSGSTVTVVSDGVTALARAKHDAFDAAILLSTGKEMDSTETALNLRDVDSSLEIIILADARDSACEAGGLVPGAIPSARILTRPEFDSYLGSPQWNAPQVKGTVR